MAEDVSWRKYAGRFRTFPALIKEEANHDVKMMICIPACAEPDLSGTLDSLYHSSRNGCHAEVLILFNKNEMMTQEEILVHDKSWHQCNEWISTNKNNEMLVKSVYVDSLPDPKGGVGWARKIIMDEAARRMHADGIIVCLDADSTVAGNYITAVYQYFLEFKNVDAASIFYEHKIDHLDLAHRNAIVLYELHLRYLINAQRWCGHPFAFSTVGSAMAVRRKAYLDQGGMNTRRAGEDFYFLQKFIEIGAMGEIRNTTVYPSARKSSRVPFGTGRAMLQILDDDVNWLTTDFQIFHHIKPLFQNLEKLRDLCLHHTQEEKYLAMQKEMGISSDVISYLQKIEFLKESTSIALQTANMLSFRRRFFRYFNSFRLMKYMHYMSEHHYPDVPVIDASAKLAKELKLVARSSGHEDTYLEIFRKYDRNKG